MSALYDGIYFVQYNIIAVCAVSDTEALLLWTLHGSVHWSMYGTTVWASYYLALLFMHWGQQH